MILISAEFVSKRAVGNVCHDVQIVSTNCFMDHTFCLTTSETWAGCVDYIGITQIAFERNVIFMLMFTDASPFYKIFVNFLTDLTAAFKRNDSECASRDCF